MCNWWCFGALQSNLELSAKAKSGESFELFISWVQWSIADQTRTMSLYHLTTLLRYGTQVFKMVYLRDTKYPLVSKSWIYHTSKMRSIIMVQFAISLIMEMAWFSAPRMPWLPGKHWSTSCKFPGWYLRGFTMPSIVAMCQKHSGFLWETHSTSLNTVHCQLCDDQFSGAI